MAQFLKEDFLLSTEVAKELYFGYAKDKPWTRVIWDVTAVAWFLNDNERFMKERLIASPIPEYDKHYAYNENRHFIKYVYRVLRDPLFEHLFTVLGE